MKKQLLVLSMVAGLVAGVSGVANADNTLTVTGVVQQTSCVVNLDNPIANLTSSVVGWGTLGVDSVSKDPGAIAKRTITLTDCTGDSAAPEAVQPAVHLAGNAIAANDAYFVDEDQSEGRVAIVASTDPTLAAANLIANGGIVMQTPAAGASFASGTTQDIYVGMVQATASAPKAGDQVKAVLTFQYKDN